MSSRSQRIKPANRARTDGPELTAERSDLLESLAKQRYFLRYTVRDLTDEQAGIRNTASELCLGGLIKHVTAIEAQWSDFAVRGAVAMEQGEGWSYRIGQTSSR